MPTRYTWLETPLGAVLLTADGDALTRVSMGAAPAEVRPGWERVSSGPGVLAEACGQLAEYFAGARTTFDLPLGAVGTPFQRRVWDALLAVPYGATATYLDVARALGDANATRAVGAANGRNPLGIVVPCHRVVGANGALTGYAGGLDRKRWLLRHEAAVRGAGGLALALG
ncbi:methylated-DNA--[protein]-cysteine S-methyltransferase [Roseisolibacter sp. H3M3-2]|uniref:methylated-DNA--[protein]-cysteine S-methyltransferase n=1 Tax=Roseisolibacter sp. H3M3-2 TaxID=3031323 RepID=UPI0023DC8DDD|nr:methylated-DNA--[protein]-cysteine S-methyltransferase [Roseisolibacter sp. H3M3-2]MDF1506253.1 methylated-DNA--[protein]-cysteine S-methyltransferase [Roseisolibacter sp. H3M3-2]